MYSISYISISRYYRVTLVILVLHVLPVLCIRYRALPEDQDNREIGATFLLHRFATEVVEKVSESKHEITAQG